MKHLRLGLALALFHATACMASPLMAEEGDASRVSHVTFAPDAVTRVFGAVDHPTLIEFGRSEPIEDVAGGGIAGWEVQKRGHRLFVRALNTASVATLLVTTRNRSYVFDLVPLKASKTGARGRMSKIVFNYDDVAATPATAAAGPGSGTAAGAPMKLGAVPLNYTSHYPYRNDNYTMQVVTETVDIRPREAFDDGRFTWFLFPKNQELPVVYKSVPGTKEETVVNSHMEGDYLVLHSVAPLWNLRLAGSTVGVFNEAYDAMGVGAGTKTVFPHIERTDRP